MKKLNGYANVKLGIALLFPCLLFDEDTVWTKNKFANINKINEKTEKHQNSRKHIFR